MSARDAASGEPFPGRPWGLAIVHGRSMLPTLHEGDRLLVRYGAAPHVGDLVVVRLPDGVVAVKRAISRGPDGWWVEADNQEPGVVDSWRIGALPAEHVLAVVVRRVWPPVRRTRRRVTD